METYGDLKKILKSISRKQKGEKIGKVALDGVVGAIPGLGTAKSIFDLVRAGFEKPDTIKTNSWLDKLDVDDHMSAIVDDTVENDFLKFISKEIEGESDDTKLDPDFNMSKKMQAHLKKQHSGRSVDGVSSFNLAKEQKDPITRYLNSTAYKFSKGYPDMNNKQDVLLLEILLSEVIGKEIILENQDLISLINKNIKDYGDLTPTGRDTIKLTYSDIPNRGGTSDSMRNDVYDEIKDLVDREESLSDYRKEQEGSSLGRAVVKFNGKDYKLIVKGASSDSSSGTDVKEALVSLFYIADIDSPFTKENYENRVNQLIEIAEKGIPGESSAASDKVVAYLSATSDDNKTGNVAFINQPLSSALALKSVYPGQKLIRTGVFDSIRKKAQSLTGLPADKWNPGDLYVQLGDASISEDDNIELINDLFNDEWGGDTKPLTSVSLKQAEAQGGKAKALLNKYSSAKEDYNLTKDEINFDNQGYIEGIKRLRDDINKLVGGNPNIKYDIESGDLKDETRFLRGKYAALKSIEFLFRQFGASEVDDAIVALVGFALSLTGVNPTFFKVTGQKSGSPGNVDKFPRGQNVILYNVDGDYDPIKITDSTTFGGLKIDFKIEKGGQPYSVSINARNNGNTQGTLEVQKIKKI